MPKTARYQNRIELLQGTLDLLILQTLQWGPQHGYGIAQAIRAGSSDVLQVDTGSLYPALHRLEKQKLVAASWKLSTNKQRTRVYRLTTKGRQQLTSERSRWARLVDAMAGILQRPDRAKRRRHSQRSAVAGSIHEARRAGNAVAVSAQEPAGFVRIRRFVHTPQGAGVQDPRTPNRRRL